MPSILFTTTSRVCRHVIRMLLDSPSPPSIRVIARKNTNNFPAALYSHPHSIVLTHHFEQEEFAKAFEGMDIVFQNGLVVHPTEVAMCIASIDAAKQHGVKHFVMSGVLQPMRRKMQTHLNKLQLEEYLMESRMNYTILEPAYYMQSISLSAVRETGKIPLGFRSDIPHSFVDVIDVADIVLMVVSNPNEHNYARYDLAAQTLTYDEIAQILSEAMGKPVRCDVMPTKDFVAKMESLGEFENDYMKDTIEAIMLYYNKWGICGNSNILKFLLGRNPTTWQEYARREG